MIIRRKTAKGKTRYGVRVERNGEQEWVGTFDTLPEARTAEAHARTTRPRTKWTCDAYVDHYLEGYALRSKLSSYDTMAATLRGFAEDWKGVYLTSVTRVEAEKWARKNGWRVRSVIAMFNDAIKAELLDRNPFSGLRQRSAGRKHITPLSELEVERLASIAGRLHGPSLRAFVTFSAYSALRKGEMFALEWDDIDFDNNRIFVRRRIYRGVTDLPKSNRSRVVVLTPPAREAALGLERTAPWVFTNKRGNRLSASSLEYAWQGIIGAFGRKVVPHELKHFCGYYLFVVLGLPDRVVAEQLGHSDGGKLVRDLYGHGNIGALDEIERAFENAEDVADPVTRSRNPTP